MKFLFLPFTTVMFLLLSSCGTWNKSGASQQDFHRESSACLAQCGQACGAQGCALACYDYYASCMMGKGWVRE